MAHRRFHRLPREVREDVIRLARQGLSEREISRLSTAAIGSVRRTLGRIGGTLTRPMVQLLGGSLSLDDRFAIAEGVRDGLTLEAIGIIIDRHKSSVCRELARCPKGAYRPMSAHRQAVEASRRPKPTKLASNPELCRAVIDGLSALWSPEQISRVLAELHPEDPSMHISPETIYKSLYVQARGELNRELARCLRTGRAMRRHHHLRSGGQINNMVMISDRPAEAEDRSVAGHWEGDLIVGAFNKSAVGTLVERTSRYVILLHLPNGRTAEEVRTAMAAKILELPAHLRRSITWDQGREMAEHATFTVDTDVQIYFCEPHSPWQRGTNENTNGLLRQYLPKSTDLSVHTAADLDAIAHSLNQRPRKTLNWATPANTLHAHLVASTA